MKPLEAVARALWQVSDRSETYESEADFWQEKARAAITALRDAGVTEGMWANWITADGGTSAEEMCANGWRAMLDAVLEDK